MNFKPCDGCHGSGRGIYGRPCTWCGGATVRADVPPAGLTWPTHEPTVDGPADYAYELPPALDDRAEGVSW